MKRNGFTLIELIFVMVVIGVLAAVALPKFKYLKHNAEISNMISAYTNIIKNGPASYLNDTEYNGLTPTEVNMTTLLKVPSFSSTAGKGWYKSNEDIIYYYPGFQGGTYMQFYYHNNGVVTITTQIINTTDVGKHYIDVLKKKLGLTFATNGSYDKNVTTIDLSAE